MYDAALDIDLYQARMLIGFYLSGMKDVSGTMDAFVRKLPPNRHFLVVCGIPRILEYLHTLRITDEHIKIFKEVLPDITFDKAICDYLKALDFSTLKVRAMKDGDIAFAHEPFISITGPIGMAQYVEKKVLSILNHDVRIASKAARIYLAAKGIPVAEFGGRRGADMMSAEAARAAYIGGFTSTSNVLAYKKYGIPCVGTQGHLWPMSHLDEGNDDGETRAYKNWAKLFKKSTYLTDTNNHEAGLKKLIDAVKASDIGGVRIDSGNLSHSFKTTRKTLDTAGCLDTKIGATNDLNEYKIAKLNKDGCKYDWYGCGTEVVSTPDSPTCGFIYKLVHVNDPKIGQKDVHKIADGVKGTLPGKKQVFRFYNKKEKTYSHDLLTLSNESVEPGYIELLSGYKTTYSTTAHKSQEHFIQEIAKIPDLLKHTEEHKFTIDYKVIRSKNLSESHLTKSTRR